MISTITFYSHFKQDICNGKKTITIRDYSESHYKPDSIVDVYTLETHQQFAKIKILSVTPILFEQINEQHAKQENMSLSALKTLLQQIYPDTQQLYVIHYKLVDI